MVQVIRGLGVENSDDVAGNTVLSGIFSCLFMGLIYAAIALVGAYSRSALAPAENGGVAFAEVAKLHLGTPGLLVLAATVTLACLKTAVGLITSCSETFSALFPKLFKYRTWAIIFTIVSFTFANLGLSLILEFSLPVLMFLYPLAITLILLSLLGKFFGYDRRVYGWVTGCTLVAAVYDLLFALPASVKALLHLEGVIAAIGGVLPFADVGLGWICPAAIGLVIGLLLRRLRPAKA